MWRHDVTFLEGNFREGQKVLVSETRSTTYATVLRHRGTSRSGQRLRPLSFNRNPEMLRYPLGPIPRSRATKIGGTKAPGRSGNASIGAFCEPARIQCEAPEDYQSRKPKGRPPRHGGQPPKEGNLLGSSCGWCMHRKPWMSSKPTRRTGQRNRGSQRRKMRVDKGSKSRPEIIKSPYRSRNPRKQRARSGGNIRTSQRTRPVAQSPEAGRCQRQHPNKGTERSQDLR